MRPRGLVLVTGITGSGKSTALASMIQHINERRYANIITIEDPIEFLHRDNQEPHQPARSRNRYRQLRAGAAPRAASGSRRHSARRDSRPRHAGDGAQGGRHRATSCSRRCTRRTRRRRSTACCRSIRRTSRPKCASRCPRRLRAVISLRLVPRADKPGRVPAAEVLINTAAVREQIRDLNATLNIPGSDQGRHDAVRHAELRPVAHEVVHEGSHLVRERAVLRQQPERVRAARAGRRRVERHELGRVPAGNGAVS